MTIKNYKQFTSTRLLDEYLQHLQYLQQPIGLIFLSGRSFGLTLFPLSYLVKFQPT